MPDDSPPPPASPQDAPPPVALRVVTTVGETTRRVDIALTGEQSSAVEDGMVATFPTRRLWPFVRDLLPDLDVVRAAPRGRPAPPPRVPGPTFVADCRAHVSIAVVTDAAAAVRTWLATDDTLWEVLPVHSDGGAGGVRNAAEGALADLLVWDVTGALEAVAGRAS